MSEPKKDWWKFGLIAYVLSLPILIWRSSRIGRAISILLLIGIAAHGLRILSGIGIGLYMNFTTIKQLGTMRHDTMLLAERLEALQQRVEGLDATISKRVDAVAEQARTDLLARQSTINQTLTDIESATADLQKDERMRVKNRIIEIKEQVKLLNKPLESAAIRKQVEEIIPGLALLKDEEKTRFLRDLSDIGFELDGLKKKEAEMWTQASHYQTNYNGATLASGAVVMWDDRR